MNSHSGSVSMSLKFSQVAVHDHWDIVLAPGEFMTSNIQWHGCGHVGNTALRCAQVIPTFAGTQHITVHEPGGVEPKGIMDVRNFVLTKGFHSHVYTLHVFADTKDWPRLTKFSVLIHVSAAMFSILAKPVIAGRSIEVGAVIAEILQAFV